MPKSRSLKADGYLTLRKQVEEPLLAGQRQIEQAKVQTYWETGRIIHQHILKHSDRAEYGSEVIARLAKDLGVDRTVLNRCFRFAQTYPRLPISAGRHKFTWSFQSFNFSKRKDRK